MQVVVICFSMSKREGDLMKLMQGGYSSRLFKVSLIVIADQFYIEILN
jgi:hypothetical protein